MKSKIELIKYFNKSLDIIAMLSVTCWFLLKLRLKKESYSTKYKRYTILVLSL